MRKSGKEPVNFWILICLVNAIVIYLASVVFSSDIVLGNAILPGWVAVVATSVLLTLLLSLVVPISRASRLTASSNLSAEMVYYGVVNMLGLWLLARAAVYTGFGISSLFVAVILGLLLTAFQHAVRKAFSGEKSKR